MENESLTFAFFIIFSGAAILASLALYTRQPLIIAYIVLGALIGPYGLELITNITLLEESGHIGIIFLLFLLGLDMQPQAFIAVAKKATLVALGSSAIFAGIGYSTALLFGFSQLESIIIGAAMMFSSTIISIKLLPTTVLHHKHAGELIVGLLLLQDLIAIFVLIILISTGGSETTNLSKLLLTLIALPLIFIAAFTTVKYVLIRLITKFDRFHEYIFLLAIGWCLGVAELSSALGLSVEIGAFIAGITLASSPISQYIAINLKPLRDFFLVMFFFTLGARFDLKLLDDILIPALLLAVLMTAIKPIIFRLLLKGMHEHKDLAWSVGFRLGQNSEFSLLIAYVAAGSLMISKEASHLIQATAILTFLISTYIVIFNFPTPIAIADRLRRD